MNRETGYYWVKLQPTEKEMHIAKWTGKYWLLHGETFTIGDRSFHKINPTRIKETDGPRVPVSRIKHSDFDWDAFMFAIGVTAVVSFIYLLFS